MIDPILPPAHAARLSIRGPVIAGLVVIATFFGGGIFAAAWMPIDKGASLSGTIIVESKSKPVQHQRGGTVSRLHVKEGDDVKAGDLIVTLDTAQLDEQVAALKAQAKAASRQLDLIRQEAAVMADLAAMQLASRSKVFALERQVAEVEKEVAGVQARIAIADQEATRAEVRAPVDGKLLTLAVRGPGEVVSPGGTIAEVVPRDERLVVEGRLSPALIDLVKPGQASKVWLAGIGWRDARPLSGRVAWVSANSVEDRRTGLTFFVTRIELDEPKGEIAKRFTLHPGQRTEILVLTGERTLIDHILDPVMRNINRAFRT